MGLINIEPVADQQYEKYSAVRSELTWSHYKSLMRVENDKACEWYMNEAADQNWSTRQSKTLELVIEAQRRGIDLDRTLQEMLYPKSIG
jgi:hypothetical protein